MKILIASDWYKPVVNGVVTSVVNLETELRRRGHDVRILTLSLERKHTQTDNVYYIKSYSAERIYPAARIAPHISWSMMEAIVDWRPDVIHTQCEFSSFHIARKISERTGAPIVHTYHTVYEDYTHYFSPSRTLGKKAVVLFTRNVLRKVDGVIAPTEKVSRLLHSYGVETGVYTVPTGIDLPHFDPVRCHKENAAMRQSLGIPQDNTVLLYLGRLAKEKKIDELLGFARRLADRRLTLLIVGGGPDAERLQARAAQLKLEGTVVFTGMVPPAETAKYYRLADVFVSASQSETQGLTYIEALANGLPALCREDECLEGVVVDGENGYQYNDFDEFAAHLYEIVGDPQTRDRMAAQARRHADEEFSSEVFAARAEEVYHRALESKTLETTAV